MGLFNKLFGGKASKGSVSGSSSPAKADPTKDPNLIRVFDGYGRELFITKQEWRDKVLLGNLEKVRNNPDQLYNMIAGSLQDDFASDLVPYAEHLKNIDPIASRGATILGIVYMKVNRPDDAQRVLDEYLARHGEDGVILTNLAKVYSQRGDEAQAEKILWHALELDPNQDNGLAWYAAIQYERGGESAKRDALRRIAAIPNSWRARLWLARESLQIKDLSSARNLYSESLSFIKKPIPTDMLMQMSGDLGINGYLAEIIQLTEPHFEVAFHGLQVGNNLIKAHFELGHFNEAKQILSQLYAQQRPDWAESLIFWDKELAKSELASKASSPTEPMSVTFVSIEGPIWTKNSSPFAPLMLIKQANAEQIGIFGSTALLVKPSEHPITQLSDGPGRFSRALPLVIAEHIHLATDAKGIALIPWMQGSGFTLFGKPYDDQEFCNVIDQSGNPPNFSLRCILDATAPTWKLNLCLFRQSDHSCMENKTIALLEDPGLTLERILDNVEKMFCSHAGINKIHLPPWYQRPHGADGSDYLLRLEQHLAVVCMNIDYLQGGRLYGEHEILAGMLHLCLRQPKNSVVRMVLVQTMLQLKKFRPDIVPAYTTKLKMLDREYPINEDISAFIKTAISELDR
jgi:tetratricopeptide (TPR) repeat protein